MERAESRVTRSSEGKATLWIEVVSRDSGAPMAGVLLDVSRGKQRRPLDESVAALDGTPWRSPRTDAAGRARFRGLSSGQYHLHAVWGEHAEGYLAFEVPEMAKGEERSQRIELPTQDDLRFFGRVVADESNAPIADAELIVFEAVTTPTTSSAGIGEREVERRRTDSAGRFELTSATWKRAWVRVVAPGRVSDSVSVDGEHAEPSRETIVRLRPSATVLATLLRAGEPLEGVQVLALGRRESFQAEAATDAEGRCRLVDLPANVRLELRVRNRSLTSRNRLLGPFAITAAESIDFLVLATGEIREATWRLGALCTVRGVARDQDGVALPGLRLRLGGGERTSDAATDVRTFIGQSSDHSSCETRTDGQGAFEVAGLHAGNWWLGPAAGAQNHGAARFATPFTVAWDTSELWLDLEIDCGIHIEGLVLDPDGLPAPRAYVMTRGPSAVADEHGAFRLGPLVRGEYPMIASKQGFADSIRVSARAGATGVVLRLCHGGTLRLRSVDRAGYPIDDCEVVLLRTDSDDGEHLSGGRDDLRIWTGLAPGIYSVRGTNGGRIGWLSGLVIDEGAQVDSTLVIAEPAARLRVSSADESYFRVRVERDGVLLCWPGWGRATEQLTVPAGECEVTWTTLDGRTQTTQVLATADRETEVVFPVR